MANHLQPSVSSTYADYTTQLNARIDDVCKGLDTSLVYTSLPNNSIGWNPTSAKWQKWSGIAWGDLVATSASYSININGTIGTNGANPAAASFTTLAASSTVSGSGFSTYLASPPAIGGTLAAAGTFTNFQATGTCFLPDIARRATIGDLLVGTTGTQTLTNKTLTAPVITSITSNTFVLTVPSIAAADSLVARNTTDTLTNKTLTSPRIGTAILDTAGANLIVLTATASAANYLTINNAVTSGTVAIAGTGTNCVVNITSTGTGKVQANGYEVVDISTSQSLTNKTISGTFTGSITGDVTGNCSGSSSSCTGNSITATIATTATATTTTNNYQMAALGVGVGNTVSNSIVASGNITAFGTSDIKFKTNVVQIENALQKVLSIGCKEFDWTDEYVQANGGLDGYFLQGHDYGVIAQDVEAVFPLAVRTRKDGTLAVDYQKLAVLAFGAIAELTQRIEVLEKK